jgi:NAD(P)-dependent dehydrogenase (short-subunit alcohol dehydrogenase family)
MPCEINSSYHSGMKPLSGKVALVAGATRGAGRGIAIELGAAGATVICTGRSTRAQASDLNRPETIEETAELVSSAGGIGIAIRCDHTQEVEVQALFERVKLEHGQLDVLVNDIWGGEKLIDWGKKFWELEPAKTFKLIERAIFTHIITARYATPLMLETGPGLILEITDGDYGFYRGNFAYDMVKNTVIRMAKGMAHELKASGLTACAITPGFLRSEEMLEHMGVTEANWQEASDKTFALMAETPHYVGRAVAALASDPNVSRFTGKTLSSWGLMHEYGFTDVDGRQPDWGVFWQATHIQDYPEL